MAVSAGRLATVLLVCLLASAVGGATLGPAGDASVTAAGDGDAPVVSVDDVSVVSGDTANVAVSLSNAPSGLSGYTLVVAVSNPGTATLESATVASAFGMTNVTSTGDGYRLKAADLGSAVEPGASDVRLATVTVSGEGPGRTNVTVSVVQVDDDGGDRVEPNTENGRVAVERDDEEDGPETTRTSTTDATRTQTTTRTDPTTTDATVTTVPTTTATQTTTTDATVTTTATQTTTTNTTTTTTNTTVTTTANATVTTTATETTPPDSGGDAGTDGFGPVVAVVALVSTVVVAARRG